ncbi:hypothetical protein CF327_g1002 [Tilletia walkeri]|uniref:chitin deacetylase n=1 Tax=Tilletia walkeri TaxID=117179 RepID=A0A8X7T5T2_9BASI|nr:hypothetical protein CF327_g1002 [Tilletia walkeri]KAE8269861.1 hypothetical protein A4X09_0g2462 [Tilletia walkeri]
MLVLRLLPLAVLLFGQASAESFRVQLKRQSSDAYPPLDGKPLSAQQIKPEWKAALDAAVKAGKIPDIPVSTSPDGGTPTYPANTDMSKVCSWSTNQCQGPNDIHQAPDGVAGINFDDGPTQSTPRLNKFLAANNISATRFLIGGQVAGMTDAFKDIVNTPNQQLAVHTYTHHQMTTLSNEVVAAELGWTMQVIYDLSGFVPSMWRGPTGDVDNRVRAIAEELFGLVHVSWDADTNDWCFGQSATQSACPGETPGGTIESVTSYIDKTFAGPKSPGVLMLEHELSDTTVGFFEQHTWVGITKNAWKHANVAEMLGVAWYANAANSKADAKKVTSMLKSAGGSGSTGTGTSTGGGTTSGGSAASGSSSASGKTGSGASSSSTTTNPSTATATGAKKSSASALAAFPGATTFAVAALGAAVYCAMLN